MSNSIRSTTLIRLISSHSLFYFSRFLFVIFFTLFIWSETKNLQIIAIYNLVLIVTHMLAFTAFAPITKGGRPHLPRNLSLLGYGVFFFFLFLLRDQVADHIYLVGALFGWLNGMYWISYNTLRFDHTTTKNRGHYSGTIRSLAIISGLAAPALGGALITFDPLGWDYGSVFLLAAILNVSAVLIGNVEVPQYDVQRFHIRKTARLVFAESDIVKLMVGKLFGNIGYKTVLEKLLPIFIFDILQNEFEVGGWLSFFSAVAVITTYLIGRYLKYQHYQRSMLLGGSLFALSTLMLVGFPVLASYILYGIIREIFFPLMLIPQRVYTENVIHKLDDYVHHRVEYIVIREWIYVFLSRVIGYSTLLFVTDLTGTGMQIILLVIGASIVLEPLILRTIKMDMTKA